LRASVEQSRCRSQLYGASLILFKHKEYKYLVQCSVLIDVTRNPRVVTSCYEIK